MLDEAIERAARVVEEKSPDMPEEEKKRVAEVVGIGAVKFAELSQNRMTDYVFNWDKMLALQGDTAPYLQNSYVRVRSIFRKLDGSRWTGPPPFSFQKMRKCIWRGSWPGTGKWCRQVLDDCRPNVLAAYLFDLARAFHSFYEAVPGPEIGRGCAALPPGPVRADGPHPQARAGPAGHPASGQNVTVSSL